MEAANAGRTEVLQILISHGADLSIMPGDELTILDGAIRKDHLDTVKLLLKSIGGPGYPTESVALQMALARSQPTMRSLMTVTHVSSSRCQYRQFGELGLDEMGVGPRRRARQTKSFA
jgi:hypothetical protein